MKVEKYLPLESLRGIAALTVAIYHFGSSSWLSRNAFVANGWLMVDFFFCLSGFVIALNYSGRLEAFNDVVRFQTKRFWRLYPLHLCMLLVFLGIEVFKYLFSRHTGIQANHPAFYHNNLTAFIANLTLTQSVLMGQLTFDFPAWSISTEFYTYIVFALIALLAGAWSRACFVLLVLVSLAVLAGTPPHSLDVTDHLAIIRCFYGFFLGVLAFAVARFLPQENGSLPAVLLLALSVAAIAGLGRGSADIINPLFFCATILAFAKLRDGAWLKRVFSHPWLVYTGTISYSIYLTHAAVWWVFTQALRFLFKANTTVDAAGRVNLDMQPLPATLITLAGLAVILLVSTLTYRLVEDRFRHGLPKGRAAVPAEG